MMNAFFGCCVGNNNEETKIMKPVRLSSEYFYESYTYFDNAIKTFFGNQRYGLSFMVVKLLDKIKYNPVIQSTYLNLTIKRDEFTNLFDFQDKKYQVVEKIVASNFLQYQKDKYQLDVEKIICFFILYGEADDKQRYRILFQVLVGERENRLQFNSQAIQRVIEHLVRISCIKMSQFIQHNLDDLLPDKNDQQYFSELYELITLSQSHAVSSFCRQYHHDWFFPIDQNKKTGLDFEKFYQVLSVTNDIISANKIRRCFCEYLLKHEISVRASRFSVDQIQTISPTPKDENPQNPISNSLQNNTQEEYEIIMQLQTSTIKRPPLSPKRKNNKVSDVEADFSVNQSKIQEQKQPQLNAGVSAIIQQSNFQSLAEIPKQKKEKKVKKEMKEKKETKGEKQQQISFLKEKNFWEITSQKRDISFKDKVLDYQIPTPKDKSIDQSNKESLLLTSFITQDNKLNDSALNTSKKNIANRITGTSQAEKKIQDHLISSFGLDFYNLVMMLALEGQADYELDNQFTDQDLQSNKKLILKRSERFQNNAKTIGQGSFNLSFESQSFLLKEIVQVYKSTIRTQDIQSLHQGKYCNEALLTVYFKVMEKVNNLLNAAQVYFQSQTTPNTSIGHTVDKVLYLNGNFRNKLKSCQQLEQIKRDQYMVDELKKVFSSDVVTIPFFFDQRQPDSELLSPRFAGSPRVENVEPVLVVIYPLEYNLRIDLYERFDGNDKNAVQNDQRNYFVSIEVLKLLEWAAALSPKGIKLNKEDIDGGTEQVQVNNQEDFFVCMAYISEQVTFKRSIETDQFNVEREREKMCDLFLKLAQLK